MMLFWRGWQSGLGGNRMFALLQLGETHAAERELRYLWMEMPEEYRLLG